MKDRTIVLNTMAGENGEVLDRNRMHLIRKESDGTIFARFNNPSQETCAIKLTLTALTPFCRFRILVNGNEECIKKANAAGILECRFQIPGLSQMTLLEERTS